MRNEFILKIHTMPNFRGLPLPNYQTPESAGFDLAAAIETTILLKPNQRALIPCGFSIELPSGFEAQIRPRSGLAINHGLTILNSPGTIDSDYRGEIKIILINLGPKNFVISRGMRIAQMIIAPVLQAKIQFDNTLSKTERGTGGFGHSGL